VNSCLMRMFGFSIGLLSSINITCFADWEMTSRQPNRHLAFSCVLYAKLTLLQVRASLFMLEASSPPAQRLCADCRNKKDAMEGKRPSGVKVA